MGVRRVALWGVIAALATLAGADPAAAGGPRVLVEALGHAVVGDSLVVTGWLRSLGPAPLGRVVVDVTGFAPDGSVAAFGSDGIPWTIPPGEAERFVVRLPLGQALIREYTLRVSAVGLPTTLADARRSVALELYRPVLLARVRVSGQVAPGELVLTSDTGRLPVALVIAEATVVAVHPHLALLQRLTVAVPPNGRRVLAVAGRALVLVDVRVVDVVPASNWDL
ncbi:MAG: hypothetical protein QN155_06280 [Armatimonadota bacterium]|nr:hypothetical protein [Armatimonadota bacterium]MDR7403115.1 hypothetical protein [Armatimonadota bacterium]